MGTAQTKIDWQGNWVGNDGENGDDYVLVRLSTNNPEKDVVISWEIIYFMLSLIDDDDAKTAIVKSGIFAVAKELRERIRRKRENDPAFRSSAITDDLLVKALNTLSRWQGKRLVWTVKNRDGHFSDFIA